MPLYVAGEVSKDSKRLVEAFLEEDEDLRRMVECAKKTKLKEVPMSNQKDLSLEAYEKANKMMLIRTLGLAVIISATVMGLLLIGLLVFYMGT
jgi:predicted nucleic acid-binding protein